MSLTIHEEFYPSPVPTPQGTESAHFFVIRERAGILRMQTVLARLSTLCGQTGAMDYLEYFLTATENLNKLAHLVVIAARSDLDVFALRAEDMLGTVLIYEYKLLGFPSKIFTTCDFNGIRTVIAPPAIRARLSSMVCRYLVARGAQVVLLSLPGDLDASKSTWMAQARAGKKLAWTTQTREVGAAIALEKTMDETLARLGSHTRRNLRYYRRKAEAELQCSFAGDVSTTLTKAQLMELNHSSTHPVPSAIVDRRYTTLKKLKGSFCVGVRAANSEWISLMAGRRHHGVTEIDWQMNRDGLAKYSVGTVIRSYLIEYEIGLGTERLFFEGGTPHTIRHSFLSEKAVDIIAVNQSPFVSLLRKSTKLLHLEKNFLLQTLVDPALEWQLH